MRKFSQHFFPSLYKYIYILLNNIDIGKYILSCFHAIPAVRFNARGCLLGCKRTVVDNPMCRHELNRP